MTTYVPYPSWTSSAEALDDFRLDVALRDALALVYALAYRPPNVVVAELHWEKHGGALVQYARALDETRRRRRGTETDRMIRDWLNIAMNAFPHETWLEPPWFGDGSFHAAERDRLRAEDPGRYAGLRTRTTERRDPARCPVCDARYADPATTCRPQRHVT